MPHAAPLVVFCTLGLRGLLTALTPAIAARGLAFTTTYASTGALITRINAGERADLGFMIDTTVDELIVKGTMIAGSRRAIAKTGVALAVKAGAPKPDISTPEAFVRAMLAARSIAFTVTGASGVYFASLIERLGIAEAVRAKAVMRDGLTGEFAASGEVEIAVQQASELAAVAGIDIIGPLPPTLQATTTFAAGIFAGSARADDAGTLIDCLITPEASALIRAKGLEPAR